ncbi:MAG: DUF4352 domain-containing protein [Lachnospiraceae bacterium]|nr:DUF4352 domain-containing protein [Lachnospiraceae bacterium]
MKKSFIKFLICISVAAPLTGCLNFIPEMTEEEEVKVVRYMADAVLEHDVNYQARLLSEEEKQIAIEEEARKAEELKKIEEEEIKKKEEKQEENRPDDIETGVSKKSYDPDEINDYLGIEGAEFEFAGEEIVLKYPKTSDNLGFAFTASDNNKLMVVRFNIKNVTSESVYVDLATSNPKFKAIINDNTKISSSKVPLDDVMNFFVETLESGEVKQAVLIYEIPEDTTVDSLDLSLSAFGKDAIRIKIK